jgi:hypothetical protein
MLWPHTGALGKKLFPSIVEILRTGEDVEFRASLSPLVTGLDAQCSAGW